MLCLSRKELERIKVGDDIWITVVRISGGKVKIGVEAPQHIAIIREELLGSPDEPTVLYAETFQPQFDQHQPGVISGYERIDRADAEDSPA